jgi:hypothetical protein
MFWQAAMAAMTAKDPAAAKRAAKARMGCIQS